MVEKQFQTNAFSFFLRKVAIVSKDLIVIGSCFQVVGESTFANAERSFKNKTLFANG